MNVHLQEPPRNDKTLLLKDRQAIDIYIFYLLKMQSAQKYHLNEVIEWVPTVHVILHLVFKFKSNLQTINIKLYQFNTQG